MELSSSANPACIRGCRQRAKDIPNATVGCIWAQPDFMQHGSPLSLGLLHPLSTVNAPCSISLDSPPEKSRQAPLCLANARCACDAAHSLPAAPLLRPPSPRHGPRPISALRLIHLSSRSAWTALANRGSSALAALEMYALPVVRHM